MSKKDIFIEENKMPKHVAIIMDGNGRWAKKRGMIRSLGHQNAIKAVREAIEFCDQTNIPYLTLYAFSTENWSRPILEVNSLMGLLVSTIKKEAQNLKERGIKVKVIGNIDKFPKNVRDELIMLIADTCNNQKGILTLALSYGAKNEILDATKKIAIDYSNNEISLEQLNEDIFNQYLYTNDLPDVDLLIRTSGEQRISNFLLWQIAYAELYFTDILWPDFNKDEFLKAIEFYQSRERRFGKVSEQLKVK
jgi:undecaprenyl diphosphate synthase